jgi:hypothetical protein
MKLDYMNATKRSDAVIQRAEQAQTRMLRNKEAYDTIGAEYEVSADRYMQRHNLYAQGLMTKAMIVLLEPCKTGKTVQQWRDASEKYTLVQRYIVNMVYEKRAAVSQISLIKACDEGAKKASESSVKACVALGKELGLLSTSRNGILPTIKLIDELQDRLSEKLLHSDVQAFCRWSTMWYTQRKYALEAMEYRNDLNFDGSVRTTFLEQIMDGTFD